MPQRDGVPPERSKGRVRLPKPVRLYEIAREAGVAPSTVSRAFSDPERVNYQTLQHIQDVAQRLGYRHNPFAAAGGGTRSGTLDLLVQDISNPYYFGLIKGAERQARAGGYTLIIGDAEEAAELEREHIRRLVNVVDGFMIAARWLSASDLQELRRQRPVVLFNRVVEGVPSVVLDPVDGSRQIIEHLASLGHRRILYLAGPRASWSNERRWESLSTAARDAGCLLTQAGPFLPTVGHGAAAADVALSRDATAVVAFNDQLAIGVLRRLLLRGISVPEQLSVVGYDNTFGSDFCEPPLTTLAASVEQAGRALTSLLLAMLEGGNEPNSIVLPTQLRIRDSTGPAADLPRERLHDRDQVAHRIVEDC